MILLSVNNLRKHYGPEPVLDGVTFDIRPGDKVSLVGPNGAGKTTLLRILCGLAEADSGTTELHSSAKLGFLEQQPHFAAGRTVWDEAAEALAELRRLAHEAEQLAHAISAAGDAAQRQRLGERFDRLQHELHHRDGYNLDHQIDRVLIGLGFPREMFSQPVEQLSGGQQNRLLMAKLLLAEPDLMLLDEPSNHLDIDATQWLEGFLGAASCAILVVSHDRYFLDKVTNRTLELLHGTVDSYSGNFSAYRRQKAERLEVQRRTYEKQQIEIAKMEDFIRRNHYGQKHAQAEDRRKKLERIERVALPREIASPPMGFPTAARSGDVALRVERLAKSYAKPLFENLSFDILRGEKWGILGPNGSGKTTLLNCLLNRVPPDSGRVIFGTNVKVGFFDQRLADLDDETLVLDVVRPDHKEFVEQQRRDLLARFGVTGDMVHQRVKSLSGGERNRTALARLSASDANFLILDEPTNHLDLWSRDALESALKNFDGTVLFVSHDRYFLNQVADHLLVVEPGRFRVIDGNYETYLYFVQQGLAQEARAVADKKSSAEIKNPATPDKPAKRKRRFPYRKVHDLEQDILLAEAHIAELHAALATPEVMRDGARVKSTIQALHESQQALRQLYEHLDEAMDLN